MHDLSRSAIDSALSQDWETAIAINEEILKLNHEDIDALSRLAYAYSQIGKLDQSRKLYRSILSIDKYNLIAQKNLEKLNSLGKKASKTTPAKSSSNLFDPNLFLEEPGKTKTVVLKNVAPASVISRLRNGDMVFLNTKKHSIEIRNSDKIYLGALPDDISYRLIRLVKAGYTYCACVKSTQKNSISVFMRENKRGRKFENQPSFVPNIVETAAIPHDNKKNQEDDEDFEV
jgi:tetratricopeptide (TPR) repeat protein